MTRWVTLVESWSADGSLAERLYSMIAERMYSTIAERLCLTLAHSLWQFGLLALTLWLIEALGRRLALATRYNLSLLLLIVGVAALPLTWQVLRTVEDGQQRNVAFAASEPADPAAIVTATPAPALDVPGLPVEPAVAAPVGPGIAIARPTRWPWAPASRWIAAIYGLGVCVMLGRLVRGVWQCQRVIRKSQPIADAALLTSLSDLALRWKLRVLPRLAAASEVAMPCVMGLMRPTIIFPLAALGSLSPSELEMILAHELAHVRRRDLWAHLVQRLAEAVLFFNPGMWYVSRRISLLREHCCDELACERKPADQVDTRIRYAQALLRLVEIQFARSGGIAAEPLSALAAAGDSPSQLRRRIAVLLGEPLRQPLRISRSGLMTLMLLAVALFFAPTLVVSNGQQEKEAKPASESESLPEDKTPESAVPPTDERFIKKHSTGVEIKLLAIGTRGEPAQRWWQPNGSLLEGEPYHVKDFERYSFDGPLTREVVFTLEKVPEGASWRCRTRPGSTSMGSGGVTDASGNRLRHHHAHLTPLPADTKEFGVEIGIAAGEWKTVAALDLPASASSRAVGEVVFAGPYDAPVGRSVLTVSHRLEGQVRLVTVYKRGVRSPQTAWVQQGAGDKLFVTQFELGGSLDQIARVEFQTRPYEWIAFDNLPTQPARVTWDANYSVDQAVKVLAIGYGAVAPPDRPRWWNSDGTPREAPATKFNGQRNSQLMSSPQARQVVFELPDYHPGAAVRFEIKSKSGWSRGELSASELESPEGQPKILHEVHTISDDDEVFTLRVGRADGEWKTVYSGDAGALAQGSDERKGVVFSGAFVQDGVTAVSVSHNWHGQNTRLTAIDKVGKKHTGKFSSHLTAAETVNQTIFEFPGLKPDDLAEFEFQVQDFTWTTIDNLPANSKPPANAKATISGRITLQDGSPAKVEGMLYFSHEGKDGNGSMGTANRFKDHYTFDVAAGTVWLAYFAKDFAPQVVGPFELEPGQKLGDIDLELKTGLTGYLKCESEDGKPVPAQVVAVPFMGDGSCGPVEPQSADEQGNLKLAHLSELLTYRVSIQAAGHQPMTTTLTADAIASAFPPSLLTIKLRRARPATGIVLLPNGEPAVGAVLKMRGMVSGQNAISQPEPKEVKVGEDGRFSIDQLVDGSLYLVLVEAADGARMMLPSVIAGQSDIKVKIPPRRDLKVRLIGDLGQLEQRKSQPTIRVGQNYTMRLPTGSGYGDYLGETIDVEATDDGGTAVYRGLIGAPIVITVGKQEYGFDGSESEVTIDLNQPPPKDQYQSRY